MDPWGALVHIARQSAGLPDPAPARAPDPTWRLSNAGLEQLVAEEGCKLEAYRDTKGIWTIGVGHTGAMGYPVPVAGMVIDDVLARRTLANDVAVFERAVVQAVKTPINQGMFDALVRWCFNIGARGMTNSTAITLLNMGDMRGAADAILMWNKPAEIRARRWREHRDFALAAGVEPKAQEQAYV